VPGVGVLTERQVVESLKALADARRSVEHVLATGLRADGQSATDFEHFSAVQKKAAIEREIAALERRLVEISGRAVGEASVVAADESTKDARKVAGDRIPALRIDAGVLAYSQATAADQVVAVTDDMKAALRVAITKNLAGGSTRGELEQRIREVLGDQASEARVERIVRTEIGRALEQQKAAHDEVLADMGVDMVKRWLHGPVTKWSRPDHIAMDGQERELWEPFHMGFGSTDETPPDDPPAEAFEVNGPMDPTLPADQVVNCKCTVVRVPRSQALQPYISKTRPVPPEAARIAASATT
jgi:hypothetical protein